MFEIFNPKYFCLGGAEDTSDELDLTEGALRSTASAGPSGQERDQSVDSTSIEDAKEGTPGFHLINLRRLTRLRSSSTLEKFDEEGTDRLKHPMHLRRACTDVVWLGCFFACTAALATLSFGVRMPHQAEHMAFLIPMHDSLNHTCGVGQVWDKPFAFICKQDSGELNFTDVICLKSCPLNSSTSNSCWTNASQSDVEMPSYVTRTAVPYLLGWCRPENNALYVSVLEYANKVWGKFSIGYGILMMWRLMVPFLIAAATGLLLSLGYVALLKDYAPTLSKIGIRLIVLVPWVWAGYLWYKHGQGALLPCVALVVVGVCIGCCAASRMHELDKAAACIKLSCTCVYQTPMLHFGPCVVLLFRVASGFGILCFIILAHTGIFVDFLERGLITFRCSAQKQDDCIYDLVLFVLWLAMFVWIQILFTASWEFAVAYLAAEWYVEGGVHEKTGKDGFRQCCKQCHVWWVLFRYHFGTMIKASIFIGAIRPFRAVLGSLTAVARLEGNPVGSILNCCCGCFVDIYEQYFEKFSVNAYIEVAVSAMNLDHAAFEASEVCERQKGTASSLNGTTFIFQLVGLTLVWWAGYFVMWMIVSGSCPGLRQYGDVYSPHYVGHQGFWSNAGGIIALTAAFPAMMVFDVVSDTILYCVMVDVMQNESKATSYWSSMPRGVLELLDLINSWTSIFSSGSSSGSSSSASSSSGE